MSLRRGARAISRPRRAQAAALGVLVAVLLVGPLHLFAPASARAHTPGSPVQVGISFSDRRATALGLDYQVAFRKLEAMHFRLIRLSAYWDEIDQFGYTNLDWLMAEANRSQQPVVLSVGMKGLGWPEFYIPSQAFPDGGIKNGGNAAEDPGLQDAALQFVEDTVTRYRQNRSLIAWQVENEPFNRAGPQRWWIDSSFLREEVSAVEALDHHARPVILNAFSHFNLLYDQASKRDGFTITGLLGFDADSAERDSLAVLHKGDILGLDVYTAIGYQFLGQNHLSHPNSDWPEQLSRLRQLARQQGKQAWITEAQAEPWEASWQTYTDPRSTSPQQIRALFADLKDAGYTTILLWGSEYWLWRDENGDARWLDTVRKILRDESRAPAVALIRTLPS